MSGDSRGYGAYLGTVPDFRAMESTEGGVLLSDVRAGGPAERAGIKGGDRILRIAGTKIANLYVMTYALQDHKPGQTVDVLVIRDEKEATFRATLGDRSAIGRAGAAPAPSQSPAAATPSAPGTPATSATTPSAPENPHAMPPTGAPATGDSAQSSLAPFLEGRPGPEWSPGAGKPFPGTLPGEKHFKEIRQLTFGGENAEPYFAPDGKHITFQATPRGAKCDQQYVMNLSTGETKMISSGKGRTTCGYFDYPEQDRIVFASTAAGGASCPPPPDKYQGDVWAIY